MTKTTMNKIINNYTTYSGDYYNMQHIFYDVSPDYFNAGLYGWNCDIYIIEDIAISTGDRNTKGEIIPADIAEKYGDKARNIIEKYRYDYNARVKKLVTNRNNFINELINL